MAHRKQIITMLRTGEVAWLFEVKSNTVRRWADRGKIKAYRNGPRGDRKFRREDVAQLLVKLGV